MKINSILIILFFSIIGCNQNTNKTLIEGNIPNLPDGTVYLYENDATNIVDSVKTKNGKFSLVFVNKKNEDEPVYLGIDHLDANKVLRAINFPTNTKYRGSDFNSSIFMSDATISIFGEFKDVTPKELLNQNNLKFVTVPKIITGKQTEALYNVDDELFEKINQNKIRLIKNKILEYPFSYHLLYKIANNKNTFSIDELKELLQSFSKEIKETNRWKDLFSYNNQRKKIVDKELPLLEDIHNSKTKILDKKYKKHLLIFWASWCGPCRAEIPLLKKIYLQKHNEVEFISISTDADKNSWIEAIKKEAMPWKQLIASVKTEPNEKLQMMLKFNNVIPYTILIDNNNKIISSSLGLSSEAELLKLINSN